MMVVAFRKIINQFRSFLGGRWRLATFRNACHEAEVERIEVDLELLAIEEILEPCERFFSETERLHQEFSSSIWKSLKKSRPRTRKPSVVSSKSDCARASFWRSFEPFRNKVRNCSLVLHAFSRLGTNRYLSEEIVNATN